MISNRQLRAAWNFVFPEGNHLMYWLYYSFLFTYPIILECVIIVVNLLHYGTTIHTDTFTATMLFATSQRCPEWVMSLMGFALNEAGYVWLMLFIHTVASTFVDIMNILDRRHDL